MMIKCGCGRTLQWHMIEEIDDRTCFGRLGCVRCRSMFGIEGPAKEFSPMVQGMMWTDAARHHLERLPPYVASLVQQDVEDYAREQGLVLISWSTLQEAKNRGTLSWSAEAEQRLNNVPGPVRAMARVELERTALDRGLSEVTVSLMEEIKARYFGMGKG